MSGRIGERRVYLDATLSMGGFVNSVEHTGFDNLIDELGNVLPGCQLYKYGQSGSVAPKDVSELLTPIGFTLDIHQNSFYSLLFNPDDRLIDALGNEDPPALSVLITDGVYSEPEGSATPPVVNAIKRWMEQDKTFGILIFKSRFNGEFYSEAKRSMLKKRFIVENRPFYAFVLSPTEQAFFDVQEKLQRQFPEMQYILFSKDAVSITSLTSLTSSENNDPYDAESPETNPANSYYWQMFNSSLFASNNPAPINYSVAYKISPNYPATELSLNVQAEYYRWNGNNFVKEDGQPPPGFKYDKLPEGSASTGFIVSVPKDMSSKYGFYHFSLSQSVKALRQDLQELSTRDDRLEENASRTFRFYELIAALTDVHFKTQLEARITPPIFMTVENQ